MKRLLDILTYKRPHVSRSERAITARYIDTIPGIIRDTFGNRILALGDTTTCFSCHLDTVHEQDGRQKIEVSRNIVSLRAQDDHSKAAFDNTALPPKSKPRTCLGADNAAGIYVLLRLIEAKKPGLYVFHRGEEVGGLGSEYLAKRNLLAELGIQRAIAFDRRGYEDIITHQMMRRCCSDVFATALASELGLGHKPCAFGTFTDTANYMDTIPECTNVSVGYHFEHTSKEWLNLEYLDSLIDAAVRTDFEKLPTVRAFNYDDEWEDLECWHSECRGMGSCMYELNSWREK